MTQKEILENISKDTSLPIEKVREVYNALFNNIASELIKESSFLINGFGKFSICKNKSRKMINPHTGKKVKTKASKTIKFKQSEKLKELINSK